MIPRKFMRPLILQSTLLLLGASCVWAAEPIRTATNTNPRSAVMPVADGGNAAATPAEHPLVPAIEMAKKVQDHIQKDVKDYTCTLIKRERIGKELGENQFIAMKVRNDPLCVYMSFMVPDKGREVMFLAGKNGGKMAAHAGSGLQARFGTVWLDPVGPMAMKDQRYPITEVGIANLTRRLLEVADNDKKFGECEVKFFPGATINARKVTCIEVTHPVPRVNFRFHKARIYLDDELNVPIRYEAYEWPAKGSTEPVLLEEYTYVDLKLNVGLKDQDFDVNNPAYHFK